MKTLTMLVSEKFEDVQTARRLYNRQMLALRVERAALEELENEWRQLRREEASAALDSMRREMGF